MSDLFGNHIVGFLALRLTFLTLAPLEVLRITPIPYSTRISGHLFIFNQSLCFFDPEIQIHMHYMSESLHEKTGFLHVKTKIKIRCASTLLDSLLVSTILYIFSLYSLCFLMQTKCIQFQLGSCVSKMFLRRKAFL